MEPLANSSNVPELSPERPRQRHYPSFASWVRQYDGPQEIFSQDASVCGHYTLTHSRLGEAFSDPATPDLVLGLISAGRATHDNQLDFGFGRFECRPRAGMIALFAPDVPTEIAGPGPYDFLTLSSPWSKLRPQLESFLDRDCTHLPPHLHTEMFYDAIIEDSIRSLHRLSQSDAPDEQIAFDEQVNSILLRLIELGGLKTPLLKPRAKLSQRDLHRVIDFIEHKNGVSLSLDELASVAGCSRFHFSRLFKATTGSSPMEHVLRWRIGRVREALMKDEEGSLAAIAIECGFADQAHMGRHFKRIVGTTPRTWREKA